MGLIWIVLLLLRLRGRSRRHLRCVFRLTPCPLVFPLAFIVSFLCFIDCAFSVSFPTHDPMHICIHIQHVTCFCLSLLVIYDLVVAWAVTSILSYLYDLIGGASIGASCFSGDGCGGWSQIIRGDRSDTSIVPRVSSVPQAKREEGHLKVSLNFEFESSPLLPHSLTMAMNRPE